MGQGKVTCTYQGLEIPERQIKASEKDPGTAYGLKRSRALAHPYLAVNSESWQSQKMKPRSELVHPHTKTHFSIQASSSPVMELSTSQAT